MMSVKLENGKSINPLTNHVFIEVKENPYLKTVNETGLITSSRTTVNLTSAEGSYGSEEQTNMIIFGKVIAVGPKCDTLKLEDEVYFRRDAIRPVPVGQGMVVVNEFNIISYVR